MSGELASERWSPAQRVESVLLSIISLLDDAECSSPANVDAGVMLRNENAAYKTRVKEDVEKSKEDIPNGFVMPTHESTVKRSKGGEDVEDPDFWVDSDVEDGDDDEDEGFGGSDTDQEEEGGEADDAAMGDEDGDDDEEGLDDSLGSGEEAEDDDDELVLEG